MSARAFANQRRSSETLFSSGGEAVADRHLIWAGTNSLGSGALQLTYFVAQTSETINQIVAYSSATAAATVTLVRFAVYSVAANGDLTLVASTVNDPTLLTVTHTRYAKATTAPWAKVAGQRYAAGILSVSTTSPTTYSITSLGAGVVDTIFSQQPRISGSVSGQTDLPASVAAASVAGSRRIPYIEMLP